MRSPASRPPCKRYQSSALCDQKFLTTHTGEVRSWGAFNSSKLVANRQRARSSRNQGLFQASLQRSHQVDKLNPEGEALFLKCPNSHEAGFGTRRLDVASQSQMIPLSATCDRPENISKFQNTQIKKLCLTKGVQPSFNPML